MTADLIALLDSDPAAGILAAADLRERRASSVPAGPWRSICIGSEGFRVQQVKDSPSWRDPARTVAEVRSGSFDLCRDIAEHIAAEANPAHALAAVRRWRGTVERHGQYADDGVALVCRRCGETWQCPDLRETADEARAYLGGAA